MNIFDINLVTHETLCDKDWITVVWFFYVSTIIVFFQIWFRLGFWFGQAGLLFILIDSPASRPIDESLWVTFWVFSQTVIIIFPVPWFFNTIQKTNTSQLTLQFVEVPDFLSLSLMRYAITLSFRWLLRPSVAQPPFHRNKGCAKWIIAREITRGLPQGIPLVPLLLPSSFHDVQQENDTCYG